MSENFWTITNPAGAGAVSLASLGLSDPQINFRVLGVSTASMTAHRDFDAITAWWEFDAVVTIYRNDTPFFTGRLQESPDSASAESEIRTLVLADAWQDLEEIIYREPWAIGAGSYLYPRCVLGLNAAGVRIPTGQQIREVVTYAISQGAQMQLGTVDNGYTLWPSEVRNASCESIISGELRFHPDWVAWLDHSTSPPTFHARPKSALETVTIDIADEGIESMTYAEVKRTVPRGVSIIYESASSIDGEVFRNAYLDEAGVTTGRRVIRAMLDLEGMNVAYQKSRIQTRDLPELTLASMREYFKKKWPELKDIPDAALRFTNMTRALVEEDDHAEPVNARATRLEVDAVEDIPRELVKGGVEDWMRKKVGKVTYTYDLEIFGNPNPAQQKILDNFSGEGKTFTVTATNATTKLYKGVSSWTAGEDRPVGIAAAIYAAATAQQHEGQVTITAGEIPAGRWHGKKLEIRNGVTVIMPATVIHAASADVSTGRLDLDYGPMPYLSAGDFLDLQRILNRRAVTWVSAEERTANTLGAEGSGGSRGDVVGGYDFPETTVPPGGGGGIIPNYWPTLITLGTDESPSYAVTITPGYVRDMKTGTGNALAYHQASNHATEDGQLTQFGIGIGQAVYITAKINKSGRVGAMAGPPVSIEIAGDNEESVQYQPKVDDVTPDGEEGTLRFKLAVLQAGGEGQPPAFIPCLAGDNIHYSPPLPALRSTLLSLETDDGIGVIPKEWDNDENAYKLRAVSKGLGKLNVKTNPDHVEVRGSKKDGNIIVHYGADSPSAEPFLKWGDGLFETGTTVIGDETEAPEVDPIHLYIPTVRSRAALPQISVTDEGAGDTKVYEVKGNGVDAVYSISINGGSQQPLVESKDGLVTKASTNINIPIPEAGTVIPAAPSITSGQIAVLTGEGEDLAWIIATVTAVEICGGSINVLTVP